MIKNNYMELAIEFAKKAASLDEVPIGAVLVDEINNKILSVKHNKTIIDNNPLKHAEMLVIEEGCKLQKSRYLNNLSIYVTLEPCLMCASAIVEARIGKVYFGAYDDKKGSLENGFRFVNKKNYFKPEIYGGINEKECTLLLNNFFELKRS